MCAMNMQESLLFKPTTTRSINNELGTTLDLINILTVEYEINDYIRELNHKFCC